MGGPLVGKTVVITGSTRGIGRAMAEACADAGATVVVSSRTSAAVEETLAALRKRGALASGIVCDVAKDDDLRALLDHAVATHGGVDVWVNNAGMSLGMRLHLETSEPEMRQIVDTNLVSTMVASKMAVEYFLGRGGGLLVNVSGRGGRGEAAAYTSAYAATKAGVMVFTKSLAAEHKGDLVSIVVFMPGMVDTDFYSESMEVSPQLEPLVGNVRIVLDAIGTPLEAVGPRFAEVACLVPGEGSGRVYRVSGGGRQMAGGFKLMWARMTGRMKPM